MTSPHQDAYQRLPDDARWAIQRADGFLDLRMVERADQELETVVGEARESLPFQQLLLRLNMERQSWAVAARLACELRNRDPQEPAYWVQWAYATRRNDTLAAASAILEEAMDHFPSEAIIPYNLACYACRTGNLDKAGGLLEQAIHIEPAYQGIALKDDDLEPLWETLEGE